MGAWHAVPPGAVVVVLDFPGNRIGVSVVGTAPLDTGNIDLLERSGIMARNRLVGGIGHLIGEMVMPGLSVGHDALLARQQGEASQGEPQDMVVRVFDLENRIGDGDRKGEYREIQRGAAVACRNGGIVRG